jgi:hypothetical protein
VETKWTGLPVHFFRQLTYTRRHLNTLGTMKPLSDVLPLLLPFAATANTLYKCTDESGVTLYTNQKTAKKNCTVLSYQPPPPAPAAAGTKPRASATPTPADFPRVSGSEQKSRDNDRRAILDKELANERRTRKSQKALFDAGNQPAGQAPALARHRGAA